MSEEYEGQGGVVRGRPEGPHGAAGATAFAPTYAGPGSHDAQIPFLVHTFRVSGLRDELHARRAAPDGWIRHA